MKLLVRIASTAAAIWVADLLFETISVSPEGNSKWVVYIVLAVILGLVNAFIKPIVTFFTLPITFITLGLFLLVINAGMLLLASWISKMTAYELHVDTFVAALLGSIVISLVGGVVHGLLGGSDQRDRRR